MERNAIVDPIKVLIIKLRIAYRNKRYLRDEELVTHMTKNIDKYQSRTALCTSCGSFKDNSLFKTRLIKSGRTDCNGVETKAEHLSFKCADCAHENIAEDETIAETRAESEKTLIEKARADMNAPKPQTPAIKITDIAPKEKKREEFLMLMAHFYDKGVAAAESGKSELDPRKMKTHELVLKIGELLAKSYKPTTPVMIPPRNDGKSEVVVVQRNDV